MRFSLIIAAVVLFSGMILAQDTTDSSIKNQDMKTDSYKTDSQDQQNQSGNITTKAWTDDLKTRLNLTDDQVTQLGDILNRYQNETKSFTTDDPSAVNSSKDELQKRYSTEIEGILDDTQKTQWQSYRNKWWDTVNSSGGQKDGTDNNFQNDRNQQKDQYDSQSADSTGIK